MKTTRLRLLPALLGIGLLLQARADEAKVSEIEVNPRTVAPGGRIRISAVVQDSDTLMGGFLLNVSGGGMDTGRNIEYLLTELSGREKARIELILGPDANSRYGDADVTAAWTAGTEVALRLIVRDMNDERTTVDLGRVTVVAGAPPAPAANAAAETETGRGSAWGADFDDGTLNGAVQPHYVIRRSGAIDDERLALDVQDGVLTLGARFDAEAARGSGDYVPLNWRDLDVSLLDFPVFECRFRPSVAEAAILVIPTLEFSDGSTKTPYFYLTFDTPGEWVTRTCRLAGDASRPTPWTPRRLTELSIWVQSDRPVSVDFDWVRLRGPNNTEQETEAAWSALMDEYEPGEPEVLREFFPFGAYAGPPDSSSAHQYQHRQTFGIMARHHLNFFLAGAPARRPGRWLEDGASRLPAIVPAAEENGIRVNLRMRRGTVMFSESGAEGIAAWARPITEQIRDRDAVVGYDVGDERPLSALHDLVACIAVLKRLDPERPAMLTFWDPVSVRGYSPYVPVNVSDIYPLRPDSGQTGAYMFEWCRRVARDTDNKRHWIILQSFGNAPWRAPRGYICPTPAELRLMTWASLAGGARGIVYYSFSYDRYKMLADQWGNPTDLLREIRRLGPRIIPLGRRLLDCIVDWEDPVTTDNAALLAGSLHAPGRGVRYAVVVNTDVRLPQDGRLQGIEPGTAFDLDTLEPVPENRIRLLPPGGGRIYLVGSRDQFRAEMETLRAYREEERIRSQAPDRTLAARYGEHLDDCLAAQAVLDTIAARMGAVEPAMFEDNPDPVVVARMRPWREPYWALHRPWADACEQLLSGRGASEDVPTLDARSQELHAAIVKALAGYPMYPGYLPAN